MLLQFDIDKIKFDSHGLMPAIAQDSVTGEVLMLAYMNAESLGLTLSTRKAHFYSRSRQKLWCKGETSGNFLNVKSLRYDCDADTILMAVAPVGPACHTGTVSCFFNKIDIGEETEPVGPGIVGKLYKILEERKNEAPDNSYVASLYSKGLGKILEKVAEEAGELDEAARVKDDKETVHELVDLWFHTLVLTAKKGIGIEKIFAEFDRRFGTSGIDEKNSRPTK
ncbi:MAG: bifunctional phosphoribosyl-AMP cyclohydrolase/phosphoribosyl-ATP diphosphatase HisIE [Proteobacteria bacterium]|nr:bifunctional phosphoribosyl-AMP cyclohydrolase/phosphoribosyl-ATP diphosphatase HisIE [Pseudomonadota bacterium]